MKITPAEAAKMVHEEFLRQLVNGEIEFDPKYVSVHYRIYFKEGKFWKPRIGKSYVVSDGEPGHTLTFY